MTYKLLPGLAKRNSPLNPDLLPITWRSRATLKLNRPFTILGRGLAPALTDEQKAELRNVLQSGIATWEQLLSLANIHECTPLWYVRLRQHVLLDIVPADLLEYLAKLHSANKERNAKLKQELVRVVSILSQKDIPVLPLKGAATFVDDLYDDPGARIMRDLDILIPQERIKEARVIY